MKKYLAHSLFTLLSFLAIPFYIHAQSVTKKGSLFYSNIIYKEDIKDDLYQSSIEDLQQQLQKATNQKIKIQTYNNEKLEQGIYVLLNRPSLLPRSDAKKLEQGTSEDFFITGT